MECELAAQREQMAAKQREHLEEKERLKQLKVWLPRFSNPDKYLFAESLIHIMIMNLGLKKQSKNLWKLN